MGRTGIDGGCGSKAPSCTQQGVGTISAPSPGLAHVGSHGKVGAKPHAHSGCAKRQQGVGINQRPLPPSPGLAQSGGGLVSDRTSPLVAPAISGQCAQ